MDLRHIRYFLAVAKAGSFRKAAEELHIAQPALTRQITALENELGVSLFEPGSRRRVLGAAGKVFAEESRAILAGVERGIERVREVGRRERVKLRIAYTEVASGDAMLASFVGRIRQVMPSADVHMLPMSSSHQVEALLKGGIDAGCLCCLPRMDDRIAVRPMTDHSMVAVLPRNHPLARRQKLYLRDLRDSKLICVSRAVRADLHHFVVEAFRGAGLPAPVIDEVDSSARITSLVSVGMGVGLLMSSTKSQLPDRLVARPVIDLPIRYRLALAWCAEPKSQAVSQLAAIAREPQLFPMP